MPYYPNEGNLPEKKDAQERGSSNSLFGPDNPPSFPHPPTQEYDSLPQHMHQSFGEMLRMLLRRYWRVISHPGAATFAEEQVYATWRAVGIQLIVLVILGMLYTVLSSAVGMLLLISLFALVPSGLDQGSPLQDPMFLLQGLPMSVLFNTLGFFVVTGILWLIAKAFRGQGSYLQYCYCFLLFYVPFNGVLVLVRWIPCLGGLLVTVAAIYMLVLLIFMTAGVHRISGGKATLAVLLLPSILLILFYILIRSGVSIL